MLLKTWQQPQGRLASNEDHFTNVQRFALEIAGEKYCYSLAQPSFLPGQGFYLYASARERQRVSICAEGK